MSGKTDQLEGRLQEAVGALTEAKDLKSEVKSDR
jgi:uncharacterized protein YjbJ (UPF0337 family)